MVSAIFKPVDDFKNAVACVIGRAVKQIKRFVSAVHNHCSLVVYEDAKGAVCCQFVKRDAFKGYHIEFHNGKGVVTNLVTGVQYQVQLTGNFYRCQCKSFKYSPLPKSPCKHLKMIAEQQGCLEQLIAQQELDQHIERQAQTVAPCIDEKDLPKGCTLDRTKDWASLEYRVYVHVIAREKGVPRHDTKCIGRIVEGLNGISAYRLRSGVCRSFNRTMDAVKYLVCSSDYSLKEVAEAFDKWDELALDF